MLLVGGDQTGAIDTAGNVTLLDITGHQTGGIRTGGDVATLSIDGNQIGTVTTDGSLVAATIVGNQDGDIITGVNLGTLLVGGDQTGAIDTTGDVTLLDFTGHQTGTITTGGDVATLSIDGNQIGTVTTDGSLLAATIVGNQDGDIITGANLGTLEIGGDQTGAIDTTGNVTLLDITGHQTGGITTGGDVATIRIALNQTGTIDTTGNVTLLDITGQQMGGIVAGGNLVTLDIGGNLSGTVDAAGSMTLLQAAGNLSGQVNLGGALNTLDVGGSLTSTGIVSTAAGQAIVNVDITGTLDGLIDAGVAGNRGQISVVNVGTFGTGRIDGSFDGDLTLDVNGRTWLLDPGSSKAFQLQADELRMGSFGGLTRDTFSIQLTESAGATHGSIVVALDASYLDLLVNQLGDDAGIVIHHSDAATTVVRLIGFDGIAGDLQSIDIHGSLTSLGGASNANGGSIVNVDNLTITGDVTAANIAGGVSGTWQTTGGSFDTLVLGGNVSGSIIAQNDIRSLTAAALTPSALVQTITGDIGLITTTVGNMGGNIVAADEIGRLVAAGNLMAYVRGYVDSAGNINALGQTAGRFSFTAANGSNGVTISNGRAEIRVNDPTDVDAGPMPVDFDIRSASVASSIAVDGSVDTVHWTGSAGSLVVGGNLWLAQTGGAMLGSINITGHAERIVIGGNALSNIYAGSIHELRIFGDCRGNVTTGPHNPLDILHVDGNISGYVLVGGNLQTRGSVDMVIAGGVSGIIQGKVNAGGRLNYNGSTYAIEPGFPFIIDSVCLRPEFNSIEHAYGLTTRQAMNDSGPGASRTEELYAGIREAEFLMNGGGLLNGASGGPGGNSFRLWTLRPATSGLHRSIDPARLAAYGDVSPWLVPDHDYTMQARGQLLPVQDAAEEPFAGVAAEESWRLDALLSSTEALDWSASEGSLPLVLQSIADSLRLAALRMMAIVGLTPPPPAATVVAQPLPEPHAPSRQ